MSGEMLMQATVIEEKDNPFFKRKELTLLLKHEASSTPSKAELVKMLAVSNGVDESQVVIAYISSKKGIPESLAKVMILNEKPPAPVVKQEAPKQEEPKQEEPKKEAAQNEAQAGQSQ